jgi:hypothetical protein
LEVEAEGVSVARTYLREGSPAEEIADLAGEIGADLVVVGSRGLGTIKRLLLGSVAEGVVRLLGARLLLISAFSLEVLYEPDGGSGGVGLPEKPVLPSFRGYGPCGASCG